MIAHVKRVLDVLCGYYSDRDGNPRKLNSVQITIYAEGLAEYPPEVLEAAARRWMKQSKFFPALSELLELIAPPVDLDALAHTAWSRLEREIRSIGAYRSVSFSQPAFGVAVRETFGSWAAACSFDTDSPGWAIRRQTFLSIFKTACKREYDHHPIVLHGLHRDSAPEPIGLLEGLPEPRFLEAAGDRSHDVLTEVKRRAPSRG
jgi:hypothetical protein